MKEAVIFKGTSDGLIVVLNEDLDFAEIKKGLDNKVAPAKKFFEGAKIIDFKGKKLSSKEYIELRKILENEYLMKVQEKKSRLPIDDIEIRDTIEVREDTQEEELYPYDIATKAPSLFIKGTVRSGQLISYAGNIIIVGDVNPSAYIRADGNIIIMGNLRGIAHAGATGDYSSIITAFNLVPIQIRIGDIIAKAPTGVKQKLNDNPEIAYVENGMINIKSYQK